MAECFITTFAKTFLGSRPKYCCLFVKFTVIGSAEYIMFTCACKINRTLRTGRAVTVCRQRSCVAQQVNSCPVYIQQQSLQSQCLVESTVSKTTCDTSVLYQSFFWHLCFENAPSEPEILGETLAQGTRFQRLYNITVICVLLIFFENSLPYDVSEFCARGQSSLEYAVG